ncbi:olfactory receptor 1468-like [Leptodactylus fuscus]
MRTNSSTFSTYFILEGFSDYTPHQAILFLVFLTVYVLSVVGNCLLLLVTVFMSQLHLPMYFFLSNLSLVDLCLTSVVVPRLISTLFKHNVISFTECISQVYFFIAFAGVECFILTVMAYDRYVAVCQPLHYVTIMSRRMCLLLTMVSWIINFINSVLHTFLVSRLSFCGSRLIQHFFCDLIPLFKLSCSDTSVNELVIFTEGFLVVALPFLVTSISYFHIIWTIMKIPSISGKKTAFSTCSTHLAVVTLFYGTMIGVYFRPSSAYSVSNDKFASVLYTVFTPMLNPFIYSLRNKAVKEAFKKFIFSKKVVK